MEKNCGRKWFAVPLDDNGKRALGTTPNSWRLSDHQETFDSVELFTKATTDLKCRRLSKALLEISESDCIECDNRRKAEKALLGCEP